MKDWVSMIGVQGLTSGGRKRLKVEGGFDKTLGTWLPGGSVPFLRTVSTAYTPPFQSSSPQMSNLHPAFTQIMMKPYL